MKKRMLYLCLVFTIGLNLISSDLYSEGELIAYWNFNENTGTSVTDIIESSVGTFIGTTEFSNDAKEGSSLIFNGTSDYVETDFSVPLKEAENITFMAWFNTTTVEGGQQHILWIGNSAANGWGPDQEMHLSINHFNADLQNSNLSLFYGSSLDAEPNNVNIVSSDASVSTDEWHHIAGVIKNLSAADGDTEAELYLDGELLTPTEWSDTDYGYANTNTTTEPIVRDGWDSPLLIGVGGNRSARFFSGSIDEVRIYNGALTVEEIVAAKEMKASSTSIANISSTEQLVYPNPTNGIIFIKDNTSIKSLQVLDLNGRELVKYSNVVGNSIDLNNLNNGAFLLKFTNNNKSVTYQKIIIK